MYRDRVTRYRFLNCMGDVVAEGEYDDHVAPIAAVDDLAVDLEDDAEVPRVESQRQSPPESDWRRTGPLTN